MFPFSTEIVGTYFGQRGQQLHPDTLEVFSHNLDQNWAIFEQMARIMILAQFLGMYVGPQTIFRPAVRTRDKSLLLQSYLGKWTTLSVWQVKQRNF